MSEDWVGHKLDGTDGSLGKIAGVTGEWIVVRAGRLGRTTAVPAADAVAGVGSVWVPYPRELIRNAPRVDPGKLDEAAERGLRDHYGID